jgi:hypothetical protein
METLGACSQMQTDLEIRSLLHSYKTLLRHTQTLWDWQTKMPLEKLN